MPKDLEELIDNNLLARELVDLCYDLEIGEEITIRKYGKVITIYQDHTDTTKIHIREDPDV